MAIDAATGRPLPDSAIVRVLFAGQPVHVYAIPPLTSTRGFNAGPWTAPPRPSAKQIFTARIRVLETSVEGQKIKVDVVLEESSSGDLFAAAPYGSASVVQAALDSSRFFAVRVVGEGGMKATLGIGFEDRALAVDFGIALTEARKVLGLDDGHGLGQPAGQLGGSKKVEPVQRDWNLKDGESIVVEIGGKGRKVREHVDTQADQKALFSIAPPPAASDATPASIPPPPAPSQDNSAAKQQAQDLGFDDGEFGEFQ